MPWCRARHSRPFLLCTLLPFAACISCAAIASAAPAPDAAAPVATSPPRPLPDYDGRDNYFAQPDDGVLTWTGRVLFSPLYFTSEYLIRKPLGAATIAAERAELPDKLYNFFVFGPDHKIGFFPAGFIEFGFQPSAGIYAFWDDAVVKDNHVRLHVEMWPPNWAAAKVFDRYDYADDRSFEVAFSTVIRPDEAFYGIGPRTLDGALSRYTLAKFDVSATEEVRGWNSNILRASVGVRRVDISPGNFGGDPSLDYAAALGYFPLPFGFDRGYIAPYSHLEAAVDTRPRGQRSGSSLRLEGYAEPGGDVQHTPFSGWVQYGVTASATADVDGHARLLTLKVGALFSDPLGPSPVPFTELVSLGGDKWMYGYFDGRLVDRSALVASLDYDWPVGPWLDGFLQVATGNVFDAHFIGFAPDLLRLSSAIGFRIGHDPPLDLTIGVGTETFAHGTQLDSVRVSFGVPRSF
ncbi:MAG TPA: hypothetical protein VHB21_12860 [Minicystis sp.]|nr:hypothetical protein [Minicystis sp.]